MNKEKIQAEFLDRYFFWRGKGLSHNDAIIKAKEEMVNLHLIGRVVI